MIKSISNGTAVISESTNGDGNNELTTSMRGSRRRRIVRMVSLTTALLGFASIVFIVASPNRIRSASSVAVGPDQAPAMPVNVFRPVATNSYLTRRSFTGMIVARRKAELGFELPGKLIRVQVHSGDQVEAGAPLAELDVERLKIRRQELVAKQRQAQSLLDELTKGPRKETIDAAGAKVTRIKSQINLQARIHVRRKKLLSQNSVSREEYEVATATLQASQAELSQAEHELLELTNGTRPEQIDAQRASFNQITLQIKNVDIELKKSVLRAPYSGTIAMRYADEGNVVSTGTPIFQLLETQALEAWVGLPPEFTSSLVVSDELTVRVEGNPYAAHVSRLLPIVDRSTHTQTVILNISASDLGGDLADGQVVRLELETETDEEGMWIPTTALEKSSRGLWTCYVLEDCHDRDDRGRTCQIERRYVEVLHSDGVRAFVRGTIDHGELIVNDATHRNVPGQLVRIGKEMKR